MNPKRTKQKLGLSSKHKNQKNQKKNLSKTDESARKKKLESKERRMVVDSADATRAPFTTVEFDVTRPIPLIVQRVSFLPPTLARRLA
jgi:hypothetical protein